MKTSEENSVYLKIIEYGYKKQEGFSYNEILNNQRLNLNSKEKEIVENFLKTAHRNEREKLNQTTPFILFKNKGNNNADACDYSISYEAFFNYIDYLELKEARKMAKNSTIFSCVAIVIAFLTLTYSIYISSKQINTPTRIDEKQIRETIEQIGELCN